MGGGRSDRIALVAGLRTPFAPPRSAYATMSPADLGRLVVRELVDRNELAASQVDLLVFTTPQPDARLNGAREIGLRAGLAEADAYSVARGAASSFQALVSAVEAMRSGRSSVAIVGGAEAGARAPQGWRRLADVRLERVLAPVRARLERVGLSPRAPGPPGASWVEIERLARSEHLSRADQDRVARTSHARAVSAWEEGLFARDVLHVLAPPRFDPPVTLDAMVDGEIDERVFAAKRPLSDSPLGTVTDANSAQPAEGAAALLLTTESRASALGLAPVAFVRAWATAACPPDRALFGPAFAVPRALDSAGIALSDVEVVELHESSAAEVIANRRALASRRFAAEQLGRHEGAVGEIADDRLNPRGGALAIGDATHASGARIIWDLASELTRRDRQIGLAALASDGGLGAAVVLERAS